ncbi:MAG: histidinol dehydrogenase [Woeseiaceae bacterium]
MTVPIYKWAKLSDVERRALLQRPAVADDNAIRASARSIIDEVRSSGDAALARLTLEYDKATIGRLQVADREIVEAQAQLTAQQVTAIDLAISNVRRFHEAQVAPDIRIEIMPGVLCERLRRPIEAVGLYVPAGTAPLPSAAIMLAVPAAIAGCSLRVLCTPPRPDGTADPAVLVAASRAGVSEIYKVGGAQAIAAMAYGTESVPKVHKIFGPGNAWVTCAKTLVSTDTEGAAIDMPAGPSEVLVIADASASAGFVASDLLSQAEHGVDSQVVLLTTSHRLAEQVVLELDQQLALLSRAGIASAALANSRILVVEDLDSAIDVSNAYAPEHLILQVAEPRSLVARVSNAGSVFVGPWTPESAGDYCSGTNHVLPTYGYARAWSGLGVEQFIRQMTVQELSRAGLESLGEAIVTLAELEGLDAHAAAVTRRLETRT